MTSCPHAAINYNPHAVSCRTPHGRTAAGVVHATERLQRSPTPISSSASPPSGGRWRPGDDVLLLADHFIRTLGAQMGKGDLKLSRTAGRQPQGSRHHQAPRSGSP